MKYLRSLLLGITLTAPVWAQNPATQPAPVNASDSPDPMLGKQFRNRIEGIALNPPNGGTMIRALDTGEIVRFVYTASGWDIRVKPINLPRSMPLGIKRGDGGVVDLMVSQLQEENPTAVILNQQATTLSKDGPKVGLIEARYLAGTDMIYAQEAIVADKDDPRHYFAIQMTSPGKPKTAPAALPDPEETKAKTMFSHVLATVAVLDRRTLREEQLRRVSETRLLWVQLDRKKLSSSIIPQHFMRILKDGVDIGFVQVDERIVSHAGNEGIEYIVRSRVETGAQAAAAPAGAKLDNTDDAGNAQLPKGLNLPTTGPAAPVRPSDIYTDATYFVSFDRNHEDWTSTTQVDDRKADQVIEMGNSDVTTTHIRNPEAMKQMRGIKPTTQPDAPLMIEVPEDNLDVSLYAPFSQTKRGKQVVDPDPDPTADPNSNSGHKKFKQSELAVTKPFRQMVPPFYLPQALGLMLPRLIGDAPEQYLFATYVSADKNVMARYVDVGMVQEVTLDEVACRAIPITDRIGVDGVPTIHYVTRDGHWLGSVNEDAKITVLPVDAKQLERIWKRGPNNKGFAVCPVPPLPEDSQPIHLKPPAKPSANPPAALQHSGSDGR